MKTPIERARALYKSKERLRGKFDSDLSDYKATGIVIDNPSCFVMAKALEWQDGSEPYGHKRAWFVQCAVGNLRQLLALIPVPLPYIAFCRFKDRHRRLRIYPIEEFKRRSHAC